MTGEVTDRFNEITLFGMALFWQKAGAAEGVQDWSDHLKMNLYLTIIGPTITLKIQGFDHK